MKLFIPPPPSPRLSTLIVYLTVCLQSFFFFFFFFVQWRVVADSAAPVVFVDPSSAPEQSGIVKVSMRFGHKAGSRCGSGYS